MSDESEDPSGASADVAEPAAAWQEPADSPAWENIVDAAEPAAPGSAEPGAAPEEPTEAQSATDAGRSRRPTSLRGQYVQDSESVPRRKLWAPAFPSAPSVPGSPVTPPVSGSTEPGNSGEVSHTDPGEVSRAPRVPNPASLLGKFHRDTFPTDKISMDKLPLDKVSMDRLPIDKLRSLTRQRPEVGLGLAFAGGLVIATIFKRLGRR